MVLQNDSPCLSDFWNLEIIRIHDPAHVKDDDKPLEKFNNTICYQEGQYFITWPWKFDNVELPENFDIAFVRMKSLSPQPWSEASEVMVSVDVGRRLFPFHFVRCCSYHLPFEILYSLVGEIDHCLIFSRLGANACLRHT